MDADATVIRPRPGYRPAADDATVIRPRTADDATVIRPRASDDATVIRPRPAAAEGEATVVRPTGADGVVSEFTVIRPRRRSSQPPLVLRELPSTGGGLIDAAATLLSLGPQLRRLQANVDVNQLHRQVLKRVEAFQQRAAAASLAPETVRRASYLLCSLIDETVLNTPWGEHSAWSQKSLLRLFHRETYGGERVFELIRQALKAPAEEAEFLELAYYCLALGFEGRYRVDPEGRLKLEQLRGEIHAALPAARDRYREALSPPTALAGLRRRLRSLLPVWVLAATLALLAFGLYSYLLIDLNERSDRLQAALAAIAPVPVPEAAAPARVRPEVVRLRELLAPEIERGVLRVEDHAARVSIVLQAEAMFPPASAEVAPSHLPVLDKIAKALEGIPGRVVVAGHTDSSAIRTPRYPSNWHLSLARASTVVKHLAGAGALAGRLLPEGRADTEPVADNATAEGRAQNRRVAIDLFYVGE